MRPDISIHALLAESDAPTELITQGSPHFYPRSPCGERLFLLRKITITVDISIHALLAESDAVDVFLAVWAVISIHALLAESDDDVTLDCLRAMRISIHALLAESDVSIIQLIE